MRHRPAVSVLIAAALAYVAPACIAESEPFVPAPLDDSLRPDDVPPPAERPSSDPIVPDDSPPGAHASRVPAGIRPADAARIIVVGDTTSAGGGAEEALTYFGLLAENDDERWPDGAPLDLETRMGAVPEIVRTAVYNGNARGMEEIQLPQLAMLLGDRVSGHSIVVVTVGIHDAISEVQAGDAALRPETLLHVRTVLRWFQDPVRFPDGTSIYLVNVTDPTNGTGLAQGCFSSRELPSLPPTIAGLNADFFAIGAELGVGVVDAHGYFMGHGFAGRIGGTYAGAGSTSTSSWFSSCVVPNERGHHELRKLLFEAIDGSYVAG